MNRPLVIVTGGSGLLGSRLVHALHTDHDVVVFDLEGDPTSPPDVEFICVDLTSDDSVDRALRRVRDVHGSLIASVVHLAAYYDFAGGDPDKYQAITIDGTHCLLDTLRSFEVEQFAFSSTMLVHEPTSIGDPIDEHEPISRSWPYPNSKIDTEAVIDDHRTASRSQVVVRIAGAYDEDGHSPPIVNQIRRIDGKWPTSHFYPADPHRGQAFVHLDDAVDALVRVVERRVDLPDHFPVLIGEPETVGYGELQDLIADEMYGTAWRTFEIPPLLAKVGAWAREKNPFGEDPFIRSWMIDWAADHYDLDITTARNHLGWQPRHRVRDVVPEMVRRLHADREGWYRRNDLTPPRRWMP